MTLSRLKKISLVLALTVPLLGSWYVLGAQKADSANAGGGRLSSPEGQSADANKAEVNEDDQYLHSASVRKIGSMMGMGAEQAATAFTVMNFVVLAALVGWLLLRTLPKTFRNRNTAIQKHLVDARMATEEASARLNVVEARLSKLDEEIAAMRAQADKDSAFEEQRIKGHVEEEKQKILDTAEQEIAAATALARRQIQQYAAELAVDQAARKLVVSAETDRLLIQSFAQRLTGSGGKGGQN